MKKLYIALSLLTALYISAQNKNTEKADKLFDRYEYVQAAEEYLKLTADGKADPYVYKQLADTYYNMFNTVEAARWYAKATETQQDAETYFRYAQMLKSQRQYEQANKQMQKFAALAPNDQRAKTFMENPNYVPRLLTNEKLFDIKTIEGLNSDKSDFGPLLSGTDFYFTTARNEARKDYGWNKEPFLDIYRGDYNPDGTITNLAPVSSLNSQYHEGPMTISADGNTMYFTSDSFRERSFERDKKNHLLLGKNNIYRATKDGSSWKNITSVPFNSNDFSTGNPSLSHDGKTLYFSSDMKGSLGGVDIWKVAVNPDGSFGTPENMGKKVNTEGSESFPFISDDDSMLYFSSNGRQGLGGLDLFRIDLAKGTDAVNLGKPVNTEKDDFGFSFNKEKNIGFFASNRNGTDDIFKALPLCAVNLITIVTNAQTGAILANASVSILDDKRNVISTEKSNAKGEVTFNVECNKAYSIEATKEKFEGNTFPAAPNAKGGETMVEAKLQPIENIIKGTEVVLNEIYFEYNKSNITREAAFELDKLVQVMKSTPDMIILSKSHTDNRGSDAYNFALSDRRAKSTVQYVISKGIAPERISGKGMGETEPKVDCKEACTEAEHAMNRRSEFLIVKTKA